MPGYGHHAVYAESILERRVGRTDSVASAAPTPAGWLAMIRSALVALIDWRPLALIGLCVVLTVLCSQAPRRYNYEIGRGAGPDSDLPFLQGFHPAERLEDRQSFRWSKAQEARIELPGLGRRGAIV